jgi:gliding motility-associated-like protein
MQHLLQKIFLLVIIFLGFGLSQLRASVPANDSVSNAIDLGSLPAPGLCPNNPDGATITFSGTTNNATFNPVDFSVTHCFTSSSPDVWYHFRATGSYCYIDITGANGLNNFFVKLHHSQGSCLSLVPLDCITSSSNNITYSFPTPLMNGDYYIQIGGQTPSETGNFNVTMKSYNDCNGCVKNGNVNLIPAPTYGRYNTGETVEMCTTVNRWESLATSYIHSIVPDFGADWDLSTLTPTQVPATVSANGTWNWYTNLVTPNGTYTGFFFDADGDGNPANNAGDNGSVLSNWTGCWTVKTLDTCVTSDLSVDVHLHGDDYTGNGNPNFICGKYDAIHISTAMSCCQVPNVVIQQPSNCALGNATLYVNGANSSDHYNFSLVDTSLHVIQSFNNTVGSVTFLNVQAGQYFVIAENITQGNCFGFQTITVTPGIVLNILQAVAGCSSGQGHAIVHVVNPNNYGYNYNWLNVPSANTNDSLAFNLPDGWAYVVVTDTVTGCSAMDSVNIFSQGYPDAWYALPLNSFCSSVDSIQVAQTPSSLGGYFYLLAPTSGGITVNALSGTIYLNNTTLTPPFYIYEKYSVGTICQSSFVDSVLIVAPPSPPVATSSAGSVYCIGSAAPVFSVSVGGNSIATWYDPQTNGTGFGNTYSPPLNGSTAAGSYFYLANAVLTSNLSCISSSTVFSVSAIAPPVIVSSNDTTICTGGSADVSINGCSGCSFVWSPAPTSGSAFASSFSTAPSASTSYTVVATNASGCTAVEYCDVTVDASASCFLNFYHGITPNGDSHNDSWVIDGIDSAMDVNVFIYNRWGEKIWEGSHYDNTNTVWKGEDKRGNPLPDGTYFFLAIIGDSNLNGWIELSR